MRGALRVRSRSPEETRILGAALAPILLPGDVISLSGDLGAGKTVFVQGLVTALGCGTRVTSPTFTLVQEYQGRYPIVHLDVYRLDSFQEVFDLGFEELLDPHAILVIEWGEAVAPLLPERFVEIVLRRPQEPDADEERDIVFRPTGQEWVRKLASMRATAETLLDAVSSDAASGSRFEDAPFLPPRDDRDQG